MREELGKKIMELGAKIAGKVIYWGKENADFGAIRDYGKK